jgi:Right handed beta helix region
MRNPRTRTFAPRAEALEGRALLATLSVLDFGAVPGDALDDAAAINAALAAAAPGDTVSVPAGEFRLGATLAMGTDRVTLAGDGPNSVLRLMPDTYASGISIPAAYLDGYDLADRVAGITVRDLTLDGNRNGFQVDPGAGDYFGVFVRQAEGLTLSGLAIRNWVSDGITVGNGVRPTDGLVIENSLIEGVHRNAIHLGFATNATIRGNTILDTPSQWWGPSAGSGIDIEVEGFDIFGPDPHTPYVRAVVIEDNFIARTDTRTAGAGIAVQPAYGPIRDVTIRGNYISGHQRSVETTGGLDIYGAAAGVERLTIAGNWMTVPSSFHVAGWPITLDGVSGAEVSGNTFNDPSGGNFLGPAVVVAHSEDVGVTGNAMYSAAGWGTLFAYVYGESTRVAVVGNTYQAGTYFPGVLADDTTTDVTVAGNVNVAGTLAWDHTPPTVTVADPGTIAGASTFIPVTVTDAQSPVARVLYDVDGLPAGHQDAGGGPWGFTFDPSAYAPGDHVVSAVAIDAAANASPAARADVTVGAPAAITPAITTVSLEAWTLTIAGRAGRSVVSVYLSPSDPSVLIVMADGVAHEFAASSVYGLKFEADGGDSFVNRTNLSTQADLYGEGNAFVMGDGVTMVMDYARTAVVTSGSGRWVVRWDLGFLIMYR